MSKTIRYRSAPWLWWLTYNFLIVPPLVTLAWFFSRLKKGKLREGLAGRSGLWGRFEKALSARNDALPLIWFHVSSAGEFLQAQPVLERLLTGGAQAVVTVSSPSGLRWAERRQGTLRGLLVVDYLPLDTASNARRLVEWVRPAALVYVRSDLWPNLIWSAARAGVPQALLCAALPEHSTRYRLPGVRGLYASLYADMAFIGAVSEADQTRFLSQCPGHEGIQVTGDTRYDSVLERKNTMRTPQLPAWVQGGRVVIVGSSWPQDEAVILPVLREAMERFQDMVLIFAPHEIREGHNRTLKMAFAAWQPVTFTSLNALRDGANPTRVLLVDTVGVLASLYRYGTVAYVGGGFSSGVHNVMEPAVMGLPVIFGPKYHNAPEAVDLLQAGAAQMVRSVREFRAALFPMLDAPGFAREVGFKASEFVASRAGSADVCAAQVKHLIEASESLDSEG